MTRTPREALAIDLSGILYGLGCMDPTRQVTAYTNLETSRIVFKYRDATAYLEARYYHDLRGEFMRLARELGVYDNRYDGMHL